MKKALLFACLLSVSCASVQCMEEERKPLLFQDDPPPYAASAPHNDGGDPMAARRPQGNDVYMTYQEWWNQHNVPANVQSRSVREQEAWMAAKKHADAQRQEEERQELIQKIIKKKDKEVSDAGQSGCAFGMCVACVLIKILSGTP